MFHNFRIHDAVLLAQVVFEAYYGFVAGVAPRFPLPINVITGFGVNWASFDPVHNASGVASQVELPRQQD